MALMPTFSGYEGAEGVAAETEATEGESLLFDDENLSDDESEVEGEAADENEVEVADRISLRYAIAAAMVRTGFGCLGWEGTEGRLLLKCGGGRLLEGVMFFVKSPDFHCGLYTRIFM